MRSIQGTITTPDYDSHACHAIPLAAQAAVSMPKSDSQRSECPLLLESHRVDKSVVFVNEVFVNDLNSGRNSEKLMMVAEHAKQGRIALANSDCHGKMIK